MVHVDVWQQRMKAEYLAHQVTKADLYSLIAPHVVKMTPLVYKE